MRPKTAKLKGYLLMTLAFITLIGCGSETPVKRGPNPLANLGPLGEPPARQAEEAKPKSDATTEPSPEPIVLNKEFFEANVQKSFSMNCVGCHKPGRQVVINNFEQASIFVVPGEPEKSDLFRAASGLVVGKKNRDHSEDGWGNEDERAIENLRNLRAWIMGAKLGDSTKNTKQDTRQDLGALFDLQFGVLEPLENPPIVELDSGSLNQPFFDSKVHGLLEESCTMCHDIPAPDFATAVSKVVFGKPEESLLYLAGSGQFLPSGMKHRFVWRNNPENLATLKAWIMGAAISPPPEPVAPNQPEPAAPNLPEPVVSLDPDFFAKVLAPQFVNSCSDCHENPAPNYETAVSLVFVKEVERSPLYLKASGSYHHRTVWALDSVELGNLKKWINLESVQ
jgi:hypothetical protein